MILSCIGNMKKAKIFIGTPMYAGITHAGYVNSLIKLIEHLEKNNYKYQHMFITNQPQLEKAMNIVAKEFLNSDCTHLLHIDADVSFPNADVTKMIKSNKEVIAGVYPKKVINWEAVQTAVRQNVDVKYLPKIASEYQVDTQSGIPLNHTEPIEVERVATGFMLIKREVFQKIANLVEECIYGFMDYNIKTKMFFKTAIDSNGFLIPSDYYFCDLFKQTGGKIYVAPWVEMQHIGNHFYG